MDNQSNTGTDSTDSTDSYEDIIKKMASLQTLSDKIIPIESGSKGIRSGLNAQVISIADVVKKIDTDVSELNNKFSLAEKDFTTAVTKAQIEQDKNIENILKKLSDLANFEEIKTSLSDLSESSKALVKQVAPDLDTSSLFKSAVSPATPPATPATPPSTPATPPSTPPTDATSLAAAAAAADITSAAKDAEKVVEGVANVVKTDAEKAAEKAAALKASVSNIVKHDIESLVKEVGPTEDLAVKRNSLLKTLIHTYDNFIKTNNDPTTNPIKAKELAEKMRLFDQNNKANEQSTWNKADLPKLDTYLKNFKGGKKKRKKTQKKKRFSKKRKHSFTLRKKKKSLRKK